MNRQWLLLATVMFVSGCSRGMPEAEPVANKEPADGLVEISEEAQKHFGLTVESAEVHTLNEYLAVPGTVQPTDSRVNTVRPLARGRLHEVLARVGDRVRQGQLLATYDNIEAGELAAQLLSARAELERLRVQERNLARQTERARALAEIGAVPKKDLEQATAEQQALQQSIRAQDSVVAGTVARLHRFGITQAETPALPLTRITSPLSGVVTKQDASPGEVIESTSALFTVADLSVVWVQAEVYEKDLGRIRLKQPAFISVDTYPNQPFTGTVTYVSDFLDPQTRTAKVRCEVRNTDSRLKLDMFATVELPTTFSRRSLAAPAGAMQEVGGRTVVFVRKTATRFEPRRVLPGKRVRDLVEITQGLTEGEPIVTSGAFHLKSILVGKELGEE